VQLDGISVTLRPRTPWEAADLGAAMLREWAGPLYRAWYTVFIPVALADYVILQDYPGWAALVLWWLKPALDRVALHVLAGAVFGEPPTVLQTLRTLHRIMRPGLLISLTVLRFNLARSFDLPLWQLEGHGPFAARKRARILHRKTRSYAGWITFACANLEFVVVMSLFGLFALLAPQPPGDDLDVKSMLGFGDGAGPLRQWIISAFYPLAVSVIEPLYVAAGFALYLNRRTLLEGWDVELGLRRIAERARGAVAAMLVVAVCGVLALAPGAARAQQEAAEAARPAPHDAVAEVMNRPEFAHTERGHTWRYTGGDLLPSSSSAKTKPSGFWVSLVQVLGLTARVIAWLALPVLAIVVIVLVRRYLPELRAQKKDYIPPALMFGLDVRPETLPQDVAGAARALLEQGQPVAALSLLYRGALSVLIHRDGIALRASDTEGDCENRVSARSAPPLAACFASILKLWIAAAYAARVPDTEKVAGLCGEWQAHFANPA
jgi:hypothetical protein